MKRKKIILHKGFVTIYFPAGIQRTASSTGSEYRLSFQKGKEKQIGAAETSKQNYSDQPALFNMSSCIPGETDATGNDNISCIGCEDEMMQWSLTKSIETSI